jgi:hypothetical protein
MVGVHDVLIVLMVLDVMYQMIIVLQRQSVKQINDHRVINRVIMDHVHFGALVNGHR